MILILYFHVFSFPLFGFFNAPFFLSMFTVKNQFFYRCEIFFGSLWGYNRAVTSGQEILNANISLGKYANTRSLGALRAPNSSLRPFGPPLNNWEIRGLCPRYRHPNFLLRGRAGGIGYSSSWIYIEESVTSS